MVSHLALLRFLKMHIINAVHIIEKSTKVEEKSHRIYSPRTTNGFGKIFGGNLGLSPSCSFSLALLTESTSKEQRLSSLPHTINPRSKTRT